MRWAMSVNAARDFLMRLFTDESFRSQILDTESDDGRTQIARNNGFDFTKQELEDAATEILDSTVGELAKDAKSEEVAQAAMTMLGLERSSTVVLLYGVVDAWCD
jgi:predicted ribosomally synthesized peptide with nif11-like leader